MGLAGWEGDVQLKQQGERLANASSSAQDCDIESTRDGGCRGVGLEGSLFLQKQKVKKSRWSVCAKESTLHRTIREMISFRHVYVSNAPRL